MLQVIKAEDVRDGEPRWWFVAQIDAETSMARDAKCTPDMLHTADRRAFKREHGWWPRFAIVDRPAPHYKLLPVNHDPRRVFADALFAAVDNLATLAELDRGELPESIAVAARAFVAAEETTR